MGLHKSFAREAEADGTGQEGESPRSRKQAACPCRHAVGAREAGKGEPSRLPSLVLNLWRWSQATPGNMLPSGVLEEMEGDPSPPGPLVFPVTQYGVNLAHLSPGLREESSWHLREGEVCGQPWDFSVTIPRPPSPGHLLLWLLGSGPWEGAHLHQREGPSCLSDLTFSQSSHWCQKLPPPAPFLLGPLRA